MVHTRSPLLTAPGELSFNLHFHAFSFARIKNRYEHAFPPTFSVVVGALHPDDQVELPNRTRWLFGWRTDGYGQDTDTTNLCLPASSLSHSVVSALDTAIARSPRPYCSRAFVTSASMWAHVGSYHPPWARPPVPGPSATRRMDANRASTERVIGPWRRLSVAPLNLNSYGWRLLNSSR